MYVMYVVCRLLWEDAKDLCKVREMLLLQRRQEAEEEGRKGVKGGTAATAAKADVVIGTDVM